MSKEPASKHPKDWSAEQRFQLLMESNALEGEVLK